jgi:phosphoribosylamine--glycine ligase
LIDGDLGEILLNAARGELREIKLHDKFAVGVVMAGQNYPYRSSPKAQIYVDKIPQNTHICYAGVSSENGEIFSSGGRVLVCVGVSDTILQARNLAYELSQSVKFSGAQFRKDIAYQALK